MTDANDRLKFLRAPVFIEKAVDGALLPDDASIGRVQFIVERKRRLLRFQFRKNFERNLTVFGFQTGHERRADQLVGFFAMEFAIG